jgi:uncharacterized membrane protein YedE/YeeE
MTDTAISSALGGGALIGLAASLVLLTHGRVAGISGIFGGLLGRPPADLSFRLAFVAGLVLAGLIVALVLPDLVPHTSSSLVLPAIAGLLVGFGARLGNGCTSGHGVCGISRLSRRSVVATLTFMLTGAITVFFVRHVFHLAGGAP